MKDDLSVSRRTVLAVGAAGAAGTVAVVALAACGSSSKKGGGTTAPAAANAPLAKLAEIEVGKCVSAKLPDGKPAIVSRPTNETAVAFSAKCTHMGCTVKPAGAELHCPCHGSVYNATTGEVIKGPAPKPLPQIDVHVAGGEVVTS